MNKKINISKKNNIMLSVKKFFINNIIFISFFVVVVYFSLVNNVFLSVPNFTEILMRSSIAAPVAFGVMLSLVVKGIDLSAGTILGLVGIALTSGIKSGLGVETSIILCLLLGLVVGLINALLIARANMNPFIATLAVMFVGTSIERVVTQGGLPIYLYSTKGLFPNIYRGAIFGIPNPILVLLTIIAIYYIFLEKSEFGRKFYASGASLKGAEVAGIKIRTYYSLAYVLSGVSAAVAGIVLASQVRSGQPMVGHSFLWDAIGAAYMSTIVSKTNKPNILGTFFGIIILSTINNGLTLIGVPFYWKEFFRGILILFILVASVIKKRYSGRTVNN